jgi:hypothetical protein
MFIQNDVIAWIVLSQLTHALSSLHNAALALSYHPTTRHIKGTGFPHVSLDPNVCYWL